MPGVMQLPVTQGAPVGFTDEQLQYIVDSLAFLCDSSRLITGFLLFGIVILLCFFCYKLFKIFF